MIVAPLAADPEAVALDFTTLYDCAHMRGAVAGTVRRLQGEARAKAGAEKEAAEAAEDRASADADASPSADADANARHNMHVHAGLRVLGSGSDASGVSTFSNFGFNPDSSPT
jgi:hypothetical protein